MLEIRIHGRGGQGAVVASKVLALAAFKEGRHVQSFPAFGVERRGAPVAAFTRIDDRPILLHCEIYRPDHLMILDPTLMEIIDVTAGLKPDGCILINTPHPATRFALPTRFRVAVVDASAIAVRHGLGSPRFPIVSTAIVGAFSRTTGIVGLEAVLEAISEAVPIAPEANVAAAKEAYEQVKV